MFSNNAEKLCSTGSTQSNENFNKVVSAKNPKTHFYGGSESTSFRVAAAVAQKNIGHESLSKVCFFIMFSYILYHFHTRYYTCIYNIPVNTNFVNIVGV